MTRGAARARGAPLEALLAADLGLPPKDAAGAMRRSYRYPEGGRESVLRVLLPSEARRAGWWDGGGFGWSWESSRWSASLWGGGPCS
jgi:hypothetical protein